MRLLWKFSTLILTSNAYVFSNIPPASSGLLLARPSAIVTSFISKPSPVPTGTAVQPCAVVSREVERFVSVNGPSSTPTVDAEAAYQCLKSVPIVKSDALQLITGLAPYFGFQTTLGFLKNPPHGYLFPGVDLPKSLAKIEESVRNDGYSSEYDFQSDIYELVISVRDGHFGYYPDVFTTIFGFETGLSIVSVSKDGLDIPQVFISSDILGEGGKTSPSRIVSINGQDVSTYLQSWSAKNSIEQDPDALYNKLFTGIARNLDESNTFSSFSLYPGPFTTLTFENGTTFQQRNIANVKVDFTGVNSGRRLYSKFCRVSSTTSEAATPTTDSTLPPPTGYPTPLVRHHKNLVAGYDLHSLRNPDVAVLAIPSFDSEGAQSAQEFQEIVGDFFAEAKALGKTKLVIDLQSNEGGTVLQGIDLFAQLFPHIVPYSAANLRATPDLDLLGTGVSDLVSKNFIPEADPDKIDSSSKINEAASLPWSFQHDIKPDGLSAYGSWPEFFGPQVTSRDNLTNLFRENFTSPLSIAEVGIVITGTLNRTGFVQPFAPEDIVLLYDGICASTCAVFSELLKTLAGVRSVAVGGRPQYGPMQGVGGTKGSRIYQYSLVLEASQITLANGSTDYQAKVNHSSFYPSSYPIDRAASASFNSYNNIRLGDTSFTPLQFVYEAANCRLFYTPEMLFDISFLWDRVADVAFRTPGFQSPYCVTGSVGHLSSQPNITDYNSYDVPASARCLYCAAGDGIGGNYSTSGGRGNYSIGGSGGGRGNSTYRSNQTLTYQQSPSGANPALSGISPAIVFAALAFSVLFGV